MAENAELQNRIRILVKLSDEARTPAAFGKMRIAGRDAAFSFEEDADAISQKSRRIWTNCFPDRGRRKTTTRPVRKPLPSPLPRAEKVPPAEERWS
ncbi:hypothetical protein [Escherichia coli]|uniref:hypothetical protein n=1 Tax=Escherichia coli TaxID=562 RepID=UPI003CC91DA9